MRARWSCCPGGEGSNLPALPDTLGVERWWGIVFFALAACEPEPRGPVQVEQPEVMRFETEKIRREVEIFREAPTAQARKRMEGAFGAFDERVRELEAVSQTQSGTERMATEQQIADLKRRRELHWTRAQTALVQAQEIQRAEPIAERVVKAERAASTPRPRQPSRIRAIETRRVSRMEPGDARPNFFERLFR